jgi:hypothetical protein
VPDLAWVEVARRFQEARNWWVHTTGRDGPHAVPVWGVVLDNTLTFYGEPNNVRSRNLVSDSRLVVTLEDAERPVIVHGTGSASGTPQDRSDVVDAYRAKYRGEHDHDYLPDAPYAAGAFVYEVLPRRAMAWEVTSVDRWEVRRWHAT